MDLAPLNDGQAHARKAAAYAQSSNLSSAQQEHELAAGAFAKAKEVTTDIEALRVLDLLQSQHTQLAETIKSQATPVPSSPTASRDGEESKEPQATDKSAAQEAHIPKLVNRTSTSPVRTRRLHRETSSTIADNLARQRRGLPVGPELSTQQAGGRILSHIDRSGFNNRQRSPERNKAQTSNGEPQPSSAIEEPASPKRTSDESYSKFYNTWEGIISKISGPLAFTGLPLTAEHAAKDASQEQTKKAEKQKPKDKTRVSSSDEPDLNKIFSAASLRAIRDDVGTNFGPQESFYLVPPTGGTVSYAAMTSGGRGSGSIPDTINEDDDEFVDAREAPASPVSLRNSGRKDPSPRASRDGSRKSRDGSGKSQEELELEISVLKQLLDTQAKRLQMWEMSSQNQSMALQQSMRAVRQRPDLPNIGSDPAQLAAMAPSAADAERIKQLENLLKAEKEDKQALEQKQAKMESDNQRLTNTVGRYRDKWEQLKAGARKKEDERRRRISQQADGANGSKGKDGGESTDT